MSNNTIRFRLAAYTDPAGKWNEDAPKKGNEDDLFVDYDLENETQGQFMADRIESLSEGGCLMVVADGMGGMNAGEVASAIAIETVRNAFKKENLTSEILSSSKSRTKYLERVIVDADAAIKKRAKADKECEGMGSTMILAWLYDNQVTVSWCGDSRAYLYRDSEGIRQISKDHSYVQGLVDEGKITIEEAFDHPYGNIITRSLGDPEKKAEPESITVSVVKGDIILVCSDGLSGVLRDRKSFDREGNLLPGLNLEDIIRENRGTMTGCREALWTAAESSEWYDNVTAILCEIVEGAESLVTKTVDSVGETSTNKSFIQFRVRKKSLRIIAYSLATICLCGLAVFFGKRLIKPKPDSEVEAFIHQKDSLFKVADSLGIIVLRNQLSALSDTVDFNAIEIIGKELVERNNTILRLEELREKASALKLDGIVKSISLQINAIRSDISYSQDISQYETSVSIGEKLLMEIDRVTQERISVNALKQKKILSFRDRLLRIETIGEPELKQWNEILQEQVIISPGQKNNESSDKEVSLTEIPVQT